MGQGQAPDSGAIVIAESRLQLAVVLGFLILVSAVAGARAAAGAQTSAGRVAAVVICGLIALALIARWIVIARQQPSRLEVGADVIRYVRRNGQVAALSRQLGDELRFVMRHRGALSRFWTLELTIAGTADTMVLSGTFSRAAVKQACRARGWRFDDKVSRIR
jgi:hypothetical protein